MGCKEKLVGSYEWWLAVQGRENSPEEYYCYLGWKKQQECDNDDGFSEDYNEFMEGELATFLRGDKGDKNGQ